jgi:anaerobic ribonucleoside-triphosphate reductase
MSEDYSSIDKSQLISMIHFFEKRDEESKKENGALKELIKELQETHKQDVKTQLNLMKSIDSLTNQVADLTTQNKTFQQKINDLLSKR